MVPDSTPEFENSREFWRLFLVTMTESYNNKKIKIIESGFLLEIARNLDKPLKDNGILDQT